ncbi:MAG: hypothetical protein WC641_02410 [Patescibacteria group bacterium]
MGQFVLPSSHRGMPTAKPFEKRNFGRGEVNIVSADRRYKIKQLTPTVPPEVLVAAFDQILRDLAKTWTRNILIRRTARRGLITDLPKAYRFVATRLRSYKGRDAIEIDLYLYLREKSQIPTFLRGVTKLPGMRELEFMVKTRIWEVEDLILEMAEKGREVDRPIKDLERQRQKGREEPPRSLRNERITVETRLPHSSLPIFISLGAVNRNPKTGFDGKPIPETFGKRPVLALQSKAQYAAWKRKRLRTPNEYRNDRRWLN